MVVVGDGRWYGQWLPAVASGLESSVQANE